MNHNSSLCHGLVLCKQWRSIPSAPLPLLVNLGLWLTEQKLIHSHVLFVYPPARTNESEVTHTPSVSSGQSPVLTEREQFPYQLAPQYLKTFKASFCFVSAVAPLSSQCLLFSPSQLSALFPYLLYALCHSPTTYLSITAVCLFFSQVYHSLLSAAAGPSRLPAPHISLSDYTVDYVLLSVH